MPRPVQRCRLQILHVGTTGAGQIAKIINNQIALVINQATRDGLRLASKAGIDEQRMLEVAMASTGDNWAIRHWEATRAQIAHYPGGPARLAELAYKDLQLAIALGHAYGVPLPLVALASQFVRERIQP